MYWRQLNQASEFVSLAAFVHLAMTPTKKSCQSDQTKSKNLETRKPSGCWKTTPLDGPEARSERLPCSEQSFPREKEQETEGVATYRRMNPTEQKLAVINSASPKTGKQQFQRCAFLLVCRSSQCRWCFQHDSAEGKVILTSIARGPLEREQCRDE